MVREGFMTEAKDIGVGPPLKHGVSKEYDYAYDYERRREFCHSLLPDSQYLDMTILYPVSRVSNGPRDRLKAPV